MEKLKVKIKLSKHAGNVLPGVVVPEYHSELAAGCDIVTYEGLVLKPGDIHIFETGISIEIPPGYEAQIRSRSGLSSKFGVIVINGVGTIDADYRGTIKVPIINIGPNPYPICKGDRIAQMVFAPVQQAEFEVVDELSETDRGPRGMGSTGGIKEILPPVAFTEIMNHNKFIESVDERFNSGNEIKIPERIAQMITVMQVLNFQAGTPTENDELLLYIEKTYPKIKEQYSFLIWPSDRV